MIDEYTWEYNGINRPYGAPTPGLSVAPPRQISFLSITKSTLSISKTTFFGDIDPSLVHAPGEAASGMRGMSMIRIGVIGAGPMGRGNASKLAAHADRCRLACVIDPNTESAQAVAEKHGARVFDNYIAALDEVDAVVIATPNHLHADQAVACAQAGKHVFIEKPMALSTADADRIVDAVDTAGVVSFVGFSVRFDAVPFTMKSIYESGDLGRLRSIWSRRIGFSRPGRRPGKPWRRDVAMSGGVLSELMAHEIDWMVSIAGIPDTVFCRKMSREHTDERNNDHIWLTLGFGAELTGTIEGSQMGTIADYYRGLMAEQGSLFTRNWGNDLFRQTSGDSEDHLTDIAGFDKYAHFLDAIEGKCASVADAAWGRTIVALTETALQSAITGRALAFSPESTANPKGIAV
ncbi:MAG: hypothetical protein GF331_25895 [Chitinivibrionales bacterium]|nr:hypothetical protein [Chitinivibrionales bacterium]